MKEAGIQKQLWNDKRSRQNKQQLTEQQEPTDFLSHQEIAFHLNQIWFNPGINQNRKLYNVMYDVWSNKTNLLNIY